MKDITTPQMLYDALQAVRPDDVPEGFAPLLPKIVEHLGGMAVVAAESLQYAELTAVFAEGDKTLVVQAGYKRGAYTRIGELTVGVAVVSEGDLDWLGIRQTRERGVEDWSGPMIDASSSSGVIPSMISRGTFAPARNYNPGDRELGPDRRVEDEALALDMLQRLQPDSWKTAVFRSTTALASRRLNLSRLRPQR